MFKNMRLRKRFTMILLMVYIITLPILFFISYSFLKRNALKEIEIQTSLLLSAWEGVGVYTTEKLRPTLLKSMSLENVPLVAMKGMFIADEIEKKIKEKVGPYSYKVSSLNPKNPSHQADSFEAQLINDFKTGKIHEEWKGFREKDGEKLFAVVRPLSVSEECLLCHGNPESAPSTIINQYGKDKGFGYKEGDIIAIRAVYVPTRVPMSLMWKNLAIFMLLYSALFFVALFILDRIIISNIIKPIEHFVETATEVSRGNLDKQFEVKTNDEMKLLADAFERMKVSLRKAIEILKK